MTAYVIYTVHETLKDALKCTWNINDAYTQSINDVQMMQKQNRNLNAFFLKIGERYHHADETVNPNYLVFRPTKLFDQNLAKCHQKCTSIGNLPFDMFFF